MCSLGYWFYYISTVCQLGLGEAEMAEMSLRLQLRLACHGTSPLLRIEVAQSHIDIPPLAESNRMDLGTPRVSSLVAPAVLASFVIMNPVFALA